MNNLLDLAETTNGNINLDGTTRTDGSQVAAFTFLANNLNLVINVLEKVCGFLGAGGTVAVGTGGSSRRLAAGTAAGHWPA